MKRVLLELLYILRNILNPFVHFHEVSVLCYHSISNDTADTTISPDVFRTQLNVLKSHGYQFVPLGDVVGWLDGNKELPQKAVALTFDDGYADFIHTAKPILDELGIPATLFILGDRETYRVKSGFSLPMLSDSDLETLKDDASVEIGYHTLTHPDLRTVHGEELTRELTSPFPSRFFAYPGGNYSDDAREKLKSLGYRAAFSIKPELVRRIQDRYLLPRIVITRGMSAADVLIRVSTASSWYRMLRRLFIY